MLESHKSLKSVLASCFIVFSISLSCAAAATCRPPILAADVMAISMLNSLIEVTTSKKYK